MSYYNSNNPISNKDNCFKELDALEGQSDSSISLQSIGLRNKFIQKVYANLSVMCILTALSCYAFINNNKLQSFSTSDSGKALIWICLIILITTIIITICFDSIAKVFPYDYGILTIFTICQSYILGTTCVQYSSNIVVMAGISTIAITLALTLFAFQTKYDCTGTGGFLLASLTGLIVIQIVNIFVHSSSIQLLAASIGLIIFSAYIIYDTQMIVGGSHRKYQFSINEHVFATINIYLDIVNLFINLLQLLDMKD
tara:strand:+ start:7012 stop:7779 length:768 start_codon:yes stop_codon:yes gene_type:complete